MFSVITVCYNEVATVAATIASVLSQEGPPVEYIVIDGGSSDGSADIIAAYRDRLAGFVSERDAGLYDAMNKGLDHATGDFVCFMNAGDRFAGADALSRVANGIGDRDRCYFARALVSGDGASFENPPAGASGEAWIGRGIPSHQATFYPRAFYAGARYDTGLGSPADTDFTFRGFDQSGWAFIDTRAAEFALGGVSNRYATLGETLRTARARATVAARHPSRFSQSFRVVYRLGPLAGWFVQRLLGPALLARMRNVKNTRAA